MSQLKEISLRRATVDDAAAIAEVRIASWRATYRGVIPDSYLDQMQLEESTLNWRVILDSAQSSAAHHKVCVFVAESDGQVIGFASGMLLPEAKYDLNAELTAIYLRPEWQRAGIGRRMLQKVARTLQQQGASSLLVWVLSANHAARHFYEELGADKLVEQDFNWDDMELREAGYGWRDISALTENLATEIAALPQSRSLH